MALADIRCTLFIERIGYALRVSLQGFITLLIVVIDHRALSSWQWYKKDYWVVVFLQRSASLL